MQRHLDEVEFTIFDTETTGLCPEAGDRIVELAALRIKGQKRIATFQMLVNPERPISLGAFEVNHITSEMLEGAPLMRDVIPPFLRFIEGSCLCSYNAGFDLGFLHQELLRAGLDPLENVYVVDVLKMARRLVPGLERYALNSMAATLGIRTPQTHRAFADVELTLKVFTALKEKLVTQDVSDFGNFLSLFGMHAPVLESMNNQKISRIQEAIDLGVRLRIRYLSSSTARVSEREVLPKKILQENKRTYLVGHCLLRNEERNFRIDNIVNLEIV